MRKTLREIGSTSSDRDIAYRAFMRISDLLIECMHDFDDINLVDEIQREINSVEEFFNSLEREGK